MAYVDRNPDGGYIVTRDDGSTFLSAIAPTGVPFGSGGGGTPDLDAAYARQATDTGPAFSPTLPATPAPSLATPSPAMIEALQDKPQPVAGLGGGSPLGDFNAQNLAVDSGGPMPTPNMVRTPPAEAAAQSFNTQNFNGQAAKPAIELGDQLITAGPEKKASIDPSKLQGAQRPMAQGPSGPTQVIKGGERKVGETYQTTSFGPDAAPFQADLQQAGGDVYRATEEGNAARAKGLEGQANVLSEIPTELARRNAIIEQNEARRQAAIQADRNKYDQLMAATNREIDPNRIWHSSENRDKGNGSIALMLGAIGSSLVGGPNVAMQIFNEAKQADIDAQKANLENSHRRFEAQRGALADNLRIFGDQRQAELATNGQYLQQAQAKVSAAIANAKTDEERANGKVVLGKLREESDKNALEMAKVTHQVHTAVIPDRVVGPAMRSPDDIDPKAVAQLPTGQTIAFPSEKSADAYKESVADLSTFKTDIATAKRLRENPEAFTPGTDAYGQRLAAEGRIKLAAPKALAGYGRAGDLTNELANAGQSWFNKKGALDSLDQAADAKAQAMAHHHQGRRVVVNPYRKTPMSGVTLGYNYADVNTVPEAPLTSGNKEIGQQ